MEAIRFVSAQEVPPNDEVQVAVSGRLGETRWRSKDCLSAIAGLQETPCSGSAKGDDHMAERETASSLQLGRQMMGCQQRFEDSIFKMGHEQIGQIRWRNANRVPVKLPSFAKPAGGRVQNAECRVQARFQAKKMQLQLQLQSHLQPTANLESWK